MVELDAIRLFLLWEGLELLQRMRAKGALRPASSSSHPRRWSLGNFTDDISALEDTFFSVIYVGLSIFVLYELLSSQGIVFEGSQVAPAVTATCQK